MRGSQDNWHGPATFVTESDRLHKSTYKLGACTHYEDHMPAFPGSMETPLEGYIKRHPDLFDDAPNYAAELEAQQAKIDELTSQLAQKQLALDAALSDVARIRVERDKYQRWWSARLVRPSTSQAQFLSAQGYLSTRGFDWAKLKEKLERQSSGMPVYPNVAAPPVDREREVNGEGELDEEVVGYDAPLTPIDAPEDMFDM